MNLKFPLMLSSSIDLAPPARPHYRAVGAGVKRNRVILRIEPEATYMERWLHTALNK
jgi:hypothetical protein